VATRTTPFNVTPAKAGVQFPSRDPARQSRAVGRVRLCRPAGRAGAVSGL